MIPARKSHWFEKAFTVYNRNLLRRRFNGLSVSGLENLKARAADVPLLLYANHVSWWDALVAFEISRHLPLDQYALMEQDSLQKFKFLRKIGAFGVVRENPRDGVKGLRYASELLTQPQRGVWIFPQGRIIPNDVRPLNLYRGAARIVAGVKKIDIVPIALRYEHLFNYKPEIFALFGDCERIEVDAAFNARDLTTHMTQNLTALVEQLHMDYNAQNLAGYRELIARQRRLKVPSARD